MAAWSLLNQLAIASNAVTFVRRPHTITRLLQQLPIIHDVTLNAHTSVVLTRCVAICVFPEAGSSGKQSKQPCYTKRKASWISWPNQPIGGAQPNSDVPFTKMETPDHGTRRHYHVHHAGHLADVIILFSTLLMHQSNHYTFSSVKCYSISALLIYTDTLSCR